jgi:hypothetical protein
MPTKTAFAPQATYSGSNIANVATWTSTNASMVTCPTTAPLAVGLSVQWNAAENYTYQRRWALNCDTVPDGVVLASSRTWLPTNGSFACPAGQTMTGIAVTHLAAQNETYQEYTSVQCAALTIGTTSQGIDDKPAVVSGDATSATGLAIQCPVGYYAGEFSRSHITGQNLTYQETLGLKCMRVQPPTCSGDELKTARCYAACKDASDPCYDALTAWCQKKAADGSYPNLIASPDMCGCHMGSAYYKAYFDKLSEAAPIFASAGVPQYESCYFGGCANGSAIQKTTDAARKCVPVTSCISLTNINNDGSIKGNINISQSAACGNSTGGGTGTTGGGGGGTSDSTNAPIFPFLPETLMGLSQTAYLAASAIVVVLGFMGLVLMMLSSKSTRVKSKRR